MSQAPIYPEPAQLEPGWDLVWNPEGAAWATGPYQYRRVDGWEVYQEPSEVWRIHHPTFGTLADYSHEGPEALMKLANKKDPL